MAELIKILFIGDLVGKPARHAVRELLPGLVDGYGPDIVIANCENSAGGFGVTPRIADELLGSGIDVLTSGNHIWDKKDIYPYLNETPRLIRPANYPEGSPGSGVYVFELDSGARVGVVNMSGRVFMHGDLDCPFRKADEIIETLLEETSVIFLDMHAETTSEMCAMGWYLDGRVSAVVGTHTHIQTADERVLPEGTAYITDAGMTGPTDSVIGMAREDVLERFLTQMPVRFEVARDGVELQGVFVTIDSESGRAESIKRIKVVL